MNARLWLGIGTTALAVIACSPGPLNGTRCGTAAPTAKTSSVMQGSDSLDLAQLNAQYTYPRSLGGYLLVTERTKDPATGASVDKTFKCAAQIAKSVSASNQINIWTAEHCIDFRAIRGLKFVRYKSNELVDGLGVYALEDSIGEALGELNRIRTILRQSLAEEVVDELFATLMPSVGKNGEQACKSEYAAWAPLNDPSENKLNQRLCSSLEDLVLISFGVPVSPSPEVQALLGRLNALEAANPIPASLRPALQAWEDDYKLLKDRKFKLGAATLAEALRTCGTASSTLSSEACAKKELIQFGMSSLTTGWSPNDTVAQRKAAVDEKFAEIQARWNTNLGNLTTNRERFHWSGNFVFGDESVVGFDFGALKIPSKTAYLSLPDLFGIESSSGPDVDYLYSATDSTKKIGAVFTKPQSLVRLGFKPGDSGSVLMFRLSADGAPASDTVYLPVGVLSTVNGGPVSGGLAMRPAGSGEESNEEDEAGGPISSNNNGGKPVVSNPCGG